MPAGNETRAGAVSIVVLTMLGVLAASHIVGRFPDTPGVDFYQFWGVPAALRLTGHTLGTPYAEGERYHAVLQRHVSTSDQRNLRLAGRYRSGGADFAGSPFLYTAFALTTPDYSASLRVFHALQVVSFVGGCLLLGWLARFDPFTLIAFPLVCLLFFRPLLSDLGVGNLGALQFGVLAGLSALASALPRVTVFATRAALVAVLLIVAAALTLAKPNIVLVTALLALHLAVRHGRVFAVAAGAAGTAALALLIAPCLYFGSWTVWPQWYRFVFGADPRMLIRSVADGNYATPLLLASWLGGGAWQIAGLILVPLAGSLIVALHLRRPRGEAGAGRPGRIRDAATRLLADPQAVLAVGILITIATSPLCWIHYYMLVLIPAFWLLSSSSRPAALLAALGVLLSAGTVGLALRAAGLAEAAPVTIAASWVPLWAALLVVPGRDGAAPAGQAATAGGPRPRRRK